jgi:hypothetical protein
VTLARGPQAASYPEHCVRKVSGNVSGEQRTGQMCTDPITGVVRNNSVTGPQAPWSSPRFDNGVAITDLRRQCYRKLGSSASTLGEPFVTAGRSVYAYLTASVDCNLPPLLRHLRRTQGCLSDTSLCWGVVEEDRFQNSADARDAGGTEAFY